jgi:signal transduction histidine kinase
MRTFLGAPIGRRGRRYGNLYLTEKQGGGTFDAEDEALVMALAAFAAGAIESAELIASERARTDAVARQAAAEERDRARRERLRAVIAAQEAERARVSRDLHDDIGQALTSVLLGLRLLDGPNEAAAEYADDARRRVEDLRELVADALRRTRQLAFELRPTVLDDIGLAPALQRLVADVASRWALTVDAAVDGIPEPEGVAPEVATVVYRVVQEALTNVVRHAGASCASVAVTVSAGRLRALVEDDGVGFDPTRLVGDGHLGLQGMRERAELVGGAVRVLSTPGSGTTVVLEVPLD